MSRILVKKIGAGGFWRVIDERADPSVVKQLTPFSCVAAVGEMLMREHGISMTQEAIVDIIGESSTTKQLADLLDRLDQREAETRWFGGFVAVEDIEKVAESGHFGAVFREGKPLGHLVLVTSVTGEVIYISDPWDGTTYSMTTDEFFKVWDGEVVFKWSLSK